jgi:uncharacterized protein (TIGR03067 family)
MTIKKWMTAVTGLTLALALATGGFKACLLAEKEDGPLEINQSESVNVAALMPATDDQTIPEPQVTPAAVAQTDAEKLRGVWRVVSRTTLAKNLLPENETWIIGKNSIVLSHALMSIGTPYFGRQDATYRLYGDLNDDPMPSSNNINLTLVVTHASEDGKRTAEQERTLYGIFAWDGDSLKLCFRYPSPLDNDPMWRPRDFPITPIQDKDLLVMVLERQKETASQSDDQRMQGDWELVAVESDGKQEDPEKVATLKWLGIGKFCFDGNRMFFPGGIQEKPAYFKLDATKSPKQIALRMTGVFVTLDGRRSEMEAKGIYALEGDDLKLLIGLDPLNAEADGGKPSLDFRTTPGSGLRLFVLRRLQPQTDVAPNLQNGAKATKKLFKVGEIIIVGNERVPYSAINRQLPLIPGYPFDEEDLKLAEKNLAACPLFVVDSERGIRPTAVVCDREDNLAGEFKDILITVKEKR